MQLSDLLKPMDQMTNEELLERLKVIRHNRDTVRPAAKAREKKESKKGAVTRINKMDDLFDKMTPAQKAEFIKQLGGGE